MSARRSPSWVGAAMTTALLIMLGGCGGGGPSSAPSVGSGQGPQRGGTLVHSVFLDTPSLDAVRCGQSVFWGPCQAVYGTLLNYDVEADAFTPGMARSFTSDDGTTWTLALRDGVHFTDGTPFDAQAVADNWERAKDSKNLSPGASTARTMTTEVVDPLTVRVVLAKPNFQLPWALVGELGFIGSPTAIQQRGADFANAPVGAGPFVLENWARGSRMTLARNPDYWDQPRPYLDQMVFAPIGGDDQRLNALRSGEVDVAATLLTEYADRATREGFQDTQMPHLGGVGVRISHTNGALVDPDVRAAVLKLVDAQQINDAFYPGEPGATTISPPTSPYFDPAATYPAVDVAAAQRLIDGHLARTGASEVALTYRLNAGQPVQDQVAQMLQAQLQRVRGLRLDILALDSAASAADRQNGNYELLLDGINGVNPDALHEMFHTGATQNTSAYSDPIVDEALDRARQTPDRTAQATAYRDALRQMTVNPPHRAWRYQTTHLLHLPTIHDVRPSFLYFLRTDLVWRES